MKIRFVYRALATALMILVGGKLFAQAPNINYTTPQVYSTGSTITPLSPLNSGGATAAVRFNSFTTFATLSSITYGLAIDPSGNVYATDYNNGSIYKYNSAGVGGTINTSTTTQPTFAIVDGLGNLFVSDITTKCVYKFNSSGTLLSTTTGFNTPYGLAVDAANNIYVADLGATSVVKIAAGTTTKTTILTGFTTSLGIAISGNDIYVAQYTANNIIKIANGVTGSTTKTTFASGFNNPRNLTADGAGNIYVADYSNNAIKKVTPAGVVTTVLSGLTGPRDMAFDVNGNLFVPNSDANTIIKSVPVAYTVSPALPDGLSLDPITGIISGTPTTNTAATNYTITAYNASGSSSAVVNIAVTLTAPDISYDTPQAFVNGSDIGSVAPTNNAGAVPANVYSTVSTFAGSGTAGAANGTGTAAQFNKPSGITVDVAGNVYVADLTTNAIRKVTPAGVVTTITTGLNQPYDLAVDPTSTYLYVTDFGSNRVRRVTIIGGAITAIAGSTTGVSGTTDGTGTNARFNGPAGIVYNNTDGFLYVTDATNNRIRKVSTAGVVTTLVSTGLSSPGGIVADASGALFVANSGSHNIKKITLAGVVTTFAGTTGTTSGSTDAAGTAARFKNPSAIAIDPSGNFYINDAGNFRIRMMTPAAVVTTIVGTGATGSTNGVGTAASINGRGLAVDPVSKDVFLADYNNNRIRRITATGYFISPTLPAGLSFNNATGVITGTPTATSAAKNYTVFGFNTVGSSSTTINISVGTTYSWDGSSSSVWGLAANWSPATVPGASDRAQIGGNTTTITNLPVIPAGTTINVGSLLLGTSGNKAATITVNGTGVLNVTGNITYQSDTKSSANSGYATAIAGTGTINATDLEVVASNNIANANYTQTLTSSITKLNLSGNISLTSNYFSSTASAKATLNVTGGTITATDIATTNDANAASVSTLTLSSGAVLNLTGTEALSELSSAGVNTITLNTGSTIGYTGSDQTIYTDDVITGLPNGITYKNLTLGGGGVKTALSGNLNIAGNFINTLANDASNYLDVSLVSVLFNGTTQTLAGGAGNGTNLYNTFFSGGGTKTISSGMFNIASTSTLNVTDNSTLAAGGFLTLKSDANGSATVPAIPAGSSITGNVNVERYISGGQSYSRGYRLLSSPVSVSSGSLIWPNLTFISSKTYTTGTGGATNGFDGSGNPSMYLYREDIPPNFTSFISGNSRGVAKINSGSTFNIDGDGSGFSIPAGNGLLLFFRGDKATTTNPTNTSSIATATTFTSTGYLNQGNIVVKNWFTPSLSTLSYTPATPVSVRGFNLVGNPYASSINWDNITGNNISNTIWIYNPTVKAYATYIAGTGGIGTNFNGTDANIIPSGQGFYIKTTGASPALTFAESHKVNNQVPAASLLLANAPINVTPIKYLRLQLFQDDLNKDEALVFFKDSTSTDYVLNEDAEYLRGNNSVVLSTQATNNFALAINQLSFPSKAKTQIIPLNVIVPADGSYSLNATEIKNIPDAYNIWLKDAYKQDSVDIKKSSIYNFNALISDSASFKNRFSVIVGQDPGLVYKLLAFTAVKAGKTVQIDWITANESTTTSFMIERSTDGGLTYYSIGGLLSTGLGTYQFFDQSPLLSGKNIYRLKQVDVFGTISYSKEIPITFSLSNNASGIAINLYPNPSSSVINLSISQNGANTVGSPSYSIKIVSSAGKIFESVSISQYSWQGDISKLLPGTYFIQVIDEINKKVAGTTRFVKL